MARRPCDTLPNAALIRSLFLNRVRDIVECHQKSLPLGILLMQFVVLRRAGRHAFKCILSGEDSDRQRCEKEILCVLLRHTSARPFPPISAVSAQPASVISGESSLVDSMELHDARKSSSR